MPSLILAQDANDAINQWLGEHPLVLGLMFAAIGLAVGGYGLWELVRGVSYDKRGRVMTGGTGKAMSIIRLIAGACCILFGLYKMLA